MNRIVITIQADESGTDRFYLEEANVNIQGADVARPLNSKPLANAINLLSQGQLTPRIVTDAGKWLFTNLSGHAAVQQAIQYALSIDPASEYPLYIQVRSNDAEKLPWEALCNAQDQFLALDKRWPIGRIAPATFGLNLKEFTLDPPVRVMAVLSATGIDARPEWEALYSAVKNAEVPIRLKVFVCQADLKTHIDELDDTNVQVDYVSNSTDLLEEVSRFAPNIIHFFCHGSTEPYPRLLLATRADYMINASSAEIRPDELVGIHNSRLHVWLITLNCCRGAGAGAHTQSLARSLVSNGVPAVIGMRELVASTDAHVFCEYFYPAAFREIEQCMGAGAGSSTEICWSKMLYEPRRRLAAQYAKGRPYSDAASELKEWTLPVLYVRLLPFNLRSSSTNHVLESQERLKKQAEYTELRRARAEFSSIPSTPQEVLNYLDQRIAQLSQQLFQ